MNFVQLVERLRVECGVSGSPLLSVQNLSGELLRLQYWINDAWNNIQTFRNDWQFMRVPFSFTTTANVANYTPTAAGLPNLDEWKRDSMWIYDPSIGVSNQMPIGVMPWDGYREMYIRGQQTPQRPITISIGPDKQLWLGPVPDVPYNITGEYWTNPITLVNDTDIPALPARFHKLIVYEAMKMYAGYEAAPEVEARANKEGGPLWNGLELDQLPAMTVAGALGSDQ